MTPDWKEIFQRRATEFRAWYLADTKRCDEDWEWIGSETSQTSTHSNESTTGATTHA